MRDRTEAQVELSSQPMCFNLFDPLFRDTALAARLLPTLVPEPVAEVTRVVLEWAPEPPDDYLGDRTAFGSGFSSQSHFTEVFRREVGTTPARWRSDG